ncbi:uncharacterized protein LOC108135494 [Drosophila elegans]|uniref:uncharacterized protein LOC108135494 n=1 Tax=Drosophila elegans TaxID=30023 RepID=UPI0007E6823A|nr:uncharacterized protein LOC108135494 [Drosophila elegans]
MDFVTALLTVGDADNAAAEYALAFMKAVCVSPENWIAKVSHQFVGQCFRVLGLNFTVSVDAFSQTQDHPYRNDNPNYIFDPVPLLMQKVDTFLDRLPQVLAEFGDILAEHSQGTRYDELTQPVPCYLNLVMKWVKVVHAMTTTMQLSSSTALDRFLCEPLARMSFSILNGLSKLLPKFELDIVGFKEICLSLTVDVRYGVFYQDTCAEVVPPMLDMFREYYKTFCGAEKSALDFVYCILTVVMKNDDSYIKAYQFLKTMINQFASSSDQGQNLYLRPFTNELITDKFLVLQFGSLNESNSKPLLMAILKYLMTLQRHLISTECFSNRFHEVLLQVVLRMSSSSAAVASLAAEVYIKLSLRQHQERDIAQHILESYIKISNKQRKNVTYAQFRAELTRYLKTLIRHFPALQEFEFYAYVLTAPNAMIELSLIAAQSVNVLFELNMAEYSTVPEARDQVNEILRCLPYFLRSSNKAATRPVLYSIYGLVDFDSVAESDVELLLTLETCCLDNFLNDDTLSESEFYGLYSNISSSVEATGNIQIHTSASRALRDEQVRLKVELYTTDLEDSENQELLKTFAQSLRRIHALLMANKLHVRYVTDMYETLVKFVLETPTQNDNITLYGSECLATMLILLHRELKDSDDEMGVRIYTLVQQLKDFCVSELSNVDHALKRAKFMFCSILTLHSGQLSYLNLDSDTYDLILESLISLPQKSQPEGTKLTHSYVRELHFEFRQLIRAPEIELPNNRIWKVFVQYKSYPPALKFLDAEIEELIGALMECRVETYAHCLPVLQMHIYKEASAKKRALAALTAHLRLIDGNCSAFDSWMLRLIIFHDSLNLLIKNMRVRRLEATSSRERNRLLPLQHILTLVADFRLQESHIMNMAKMVHILKEEVVGAQESSEIESFITQISKFKYQVEDEHLEASDNENFVGKLKALPPGALDFWQHNALRELSRLSASQTREVPSSAGESS